LTRAHRFIILAVLFVLTLPLVAFVFAAYNKVSAAYASSVNIPASYVNMGVPHGLAMAADGDIWYVDTANKRLVKFDPVTDTIIRTVGRLGSGDGEFDSSIWSLTIDNQGYLYVISTEGKIYKFDANGGFIAKADFPCGDPVTLGCLNGPHSITYDAHSDSLFIVSTYTDRVERYSKNLVYLNQGFGEHGTADGQFDQPWGASTDSAGNIYVADEFNARAQVFGPGPTFTHLYTINTFGYSGDPDEGHDKWAHDTKDIVISQDGTINISTPNSRYVMQFSYNGSEVSYLGNIGNLSVPNDNLLAPEFIINDIHDPGYIYISDAQHNSVDKYTGDGVYQSSLKNLSLADGKLYFPGDVAYDSLGNLYVLDLNWFSNTQVIEYSHIDGSYVATIVNGDYGGTAENLLFGPTGKLYISAIGQVTEFTDISGTWTVTNVIGTFGSGTGQLESARGIAFDNEGVLYVADYDNQRVQKFSYDGGTEEWSPDGAFSVDCSSGGGPRGIVFDSLGNIYVTTMAKLIKFDSNGANPEVLSEGGYVAMSIYNNILYVSSEASLVYVFNTSGDLLEQFGSEGSGQSQFQQSWGLAVSPVAPHTLTVADVLSGRVEEFVSGNRIINLIPSANVVIRTHEGSESGVLDAHAGESLSDQTWDPGVYDLTAIPARLIFGDYVVADFTVNLTSDRDWSAVNVQTSPYNSKALVVNLTIGAAPGISGTHSLYLYRYDNQPSVNVCPVATSLAQLIPSCTGEYTLQPGDQYLSMVTIDGVNYWEIDNLSGTGAFASLFETSFLLRDLMTREQAGVASNHQISFGTTYDVTHPDDTITLTFSADWNLSTINVTDISLMSDITSLTLSDAGPDINTWGVVVDNLNHQIIFTAPTSGVGYISSDTAVAVLINNAVLINPVTQASYALDLRIYSSDGDSGHNLETGSIIIPVVDSDQVDVTGYVNNYLVFDIDTGTADDINCGYAGCDLYAGVGPAGNYTIDLGEMSSTWVNMSQNGNVSHSDGGSGAINSIYLDLTSNAVNGTVVTMSSANQGLLGPDSEKILPVTDGSDVTLNSGIYGYTLASITNTPAHGTVSLASNCEAAGAYCGPTTDPKSVFNTNGSPVDGARVRIDLAAAAAYTDSPGTYTDTLTFVATSTF